MSVSFKTRVKRRIAILITLLFVFGTIFPGQFVNASSAKPSVSDQVIPLIEVGNGEGAVTPTPTPSPVEIEPKLVLTTKMFDVKAQNGPLYVGGTIGMTKKFILIAPKGAERVESFSADKTKALAQYLVRYGTSNPEIVGVTSEGIITAVKEGTCLITAVVELSDGSNRVFELTIVVKRASITLIDFTNQIKVGEKFTFKISVKGYRLSDIKWMTAKRSGAVVASNKGKLTAVVKGVSAKADVIYIYVGDTIYRMNIKVIK